MQRISSQQYREMLEQGRVRISSKYNVDLSAGGRARRTFDGVAYDSVAEAEFAAFLARSDAVVGVVRQPQIVIAGNKYRVDFLVETANRVGVIPRGVSLIDVKGRVLQRARDLLRAYASSRCRWPLLFVRQRRLRGVLSWELVAQIVPGSEEASR